VKCDTKKQNAVVQKEMMEQVEKILTERGSRALEEARNQILHEKIECNEAREALTYFMSEYWRDVFGPTLLSLSCEAVGGDPNLTTPIAVPMILISGAIDIHDDIIDQSKSKWLRPTVLGKFGKDIALLVGDALLFKGFKLLYEAVEKGVSAEKVAAIIDIIEKTFFELGDAEALELGFRGRVDVTPEEYLYVVRKKAADVEACTHISALLGRGSKEEVEALREYGRLLGMMLILRDDLLDMINFDESVHRIRRESLPLPLLYALQKPKIRSTLSPLLLKKRIRKGDAKTILLVTDEAGGLDLCRKKMQELAENAYNRVEKLRYTIEYLKLLAKSVLPPLNEWRSLASPNV